MDYNFIVKEGGNGMVIVIECKDENSISSLKLDEIQIANKI